MKRVCVYCGSNPGARPDYAEAATALARTLAERGVGLVYGGANVGVMGVIASAVLEAGGEAIGVLPRKLRAKELAHSGLTELHMVDSMHERKALMVELADGFVALPGGTGTLDELFETMTWSQLGLHNKPMGLLNVSGYYDHLLAFLDHVVGERFLRGEHRDMLLVANEPGALLDAMANYVPPKIDKWIDRASS
jgi:uncharacterized protein (TIGR00730 family)